MSNHRSIDMLISSCFRCSKYKSLMFDEYLAGLHNLLFFSALTPCCYLYPSLFLYLFSFSFLFFFFTSGCHYSLLFLRVP